jgi:hypothetical protein
MNQNCLQKVLDQVNFYPHGITFRAQNKLNSSSLTESKVGWYTHQFQALLEFIC